MANSPPTSQPASRNAAGSHTPRCTHDDDGSGLSIPSFTDNDGGGRGLSTPSFTDDDGGGSSSSVPTDTSIQ